MRNYTYCDLEDFRKNYKENIHGYLSLTVCILGSIANIFNICVLKTKHMRSATNLILTGLAVADLLVMLQYIPFTIHRNLHSLPVRYTHYSYCWAVFYKFHSLFTLILHFIACSLTVILAVWRYAFVSQVHASEIFTDKKKTSVVVLLTYLICPVICIPMFSTLEIMKHQQTCDLYGVIVNKEDKHKYNQSLLKNETIFFVHPNDPYFVSIWIYSLLLKLGPCVLLTILSCKIIAVLVETRRRRLMLLSSSNRGDIDGKTGSIQLYKESQSDRTTRMLLAVLFLFLLTEFPQAIVGQISAMYGNVFLEECYAALGDVMDIVALINSSINFILYCTMSRQFRETFKELFHVHYFVQWIHPQSRQISMEETRGDTKMSTV
ncbi:sex peptide receptor-like [Sitophilus oryzae]|uniref:Sex peptide receptor-like n=1 Tax=Sitophilus oryzae TaxID=7048 RepID=A0A6J2XYA4_SITOR|nr:sex peptide receptor-like [Sitophilus oryzae]